MMKTMCKRTLAFLLCALLLCSALSFAASAADVVSGECGADGGNVTWTLNKGTGVLTISGSGEMADYLFDDQPWLSNCSVIRTVTIGYGVTSIGGSAFADCSNLSQVTISDSVKTLFYRCFSGCSALQTVTLPNKLEVIATNAFNACDCLTKITIPDSVTCIGTYAFSNCTKMKTVSLGNGVQQIGRGAFSYCESLEEIMLPKSLTDYDFQSGGDGADCVSVFTGCTNLQNIRVEAGNSEYCDIDGVLFNKERTVLLAYPGGRSGSYTVPDGVTSIGLGFAYDSAFMECEKLTGISFPDSLRVIGGSAFYGCIGLTEVSIPAGTTEVGYWAFYGCTGLKKVTLLSKDVRIGTCAFGECAGLLTAGPVGGGYNFEFQWSPTIPEYACNLITSLTSVVIPSGVTAIDQIAFMGCDSLNYVHIPASVTMIGNEAFRGCDKLEFICSDTADCYAKTYAKANGIPFRVCDGTHDEPAQAPAFHGDAGEVKAECPDGTFSEETYLRVSQDSSAKDPLAEFGVMIKGFAHVQQLYFIHVQNEQGEYVQPNEGHTVTLHLPLILDETGNPYPLEKYSVYHVDSETGRVESFRAKNNNLRIEGGYLVFEVSRFSPFIVTVEEDAPTLKLQDTKKTLPYGEKRTLTADVENLPDGAKVVWTADNDSVTLTPSADGKTCEVSAQKNGKVIVTATVIDKDGNSIEQDGETVSVRVTLQTKANIFHKLWYWIFRIPWPFG